jgi:DME family drug/metabolite transporter
MSRLWVLLSALCFGTTGTAQALGPDAATPATVGAARILVGAVLLGAAVAGERVTGLAIGALALILGGVAIVATQKPAAEPAARVAPPVARDSRARTG